MNGLRTIEDFFDITADKYEITIFGEKPHFNYK
jgi:nitrite reductase (NADH) large subunit